MITAVEPEVPKLGLAEFDPTEIPHLEVVVRNSKHDVVANVGAQLVALIVSPQNHVLYLEAVCTSDAGAHAIMGSVSDPRGAVEFRFYRTGDGDYVEIEQNQKLNSVKDELSRENERTRGKLEVIFAIVRLLVYLGVTAGVILALAFHGKAKKVIESKSWGKPVLYCGIALYIVYDVIVNAAIIIDWLREHMF